MVSTIGGSGTAQSVANTRASAGTHAASGTGTAAKVYDPRDTNKDGKVSYLEQLMWDLQHGTESTKGSSSSTQSASYDASGKATSQTSSGKLDVYL